ncbi:MAG: FeoB-associated Cys-rich membrane protein [Christensenellaceae bacterium]|nr:FeoB-associated Cys-rich membrane protein [Christensenellaceae bacterium]
MIEFIKANLGTIVVSLLLIAIVLLIIRYMLLQKRRNISPFCSGCSGCALNGTCGASKESDRTQS